VTGLEFALSELGLTKAGLARELGITKGAVQTWTHVPYDHALILFDAHNLDISRLNPDVYPVRLFK